MKEILPTKRFDDNFKEVVKPKKCYSDLNNSLSHCAGYKVGDCNCEAYNQAQQRKVLCSLSEFVLTIKNDCNYEPTVWKGCIETDKHYSIYNYTDYITQPITEKSLEGVESVVLPEPIPNTHYVRIVINGNAYPIKQSYKTIEHAINDGVLFILKD